MYRVMFQAVVRQFLPAEILFSLRPILVGFVVYKLALGQAWLRVLYTHTFIYQRHYIILCFVDLRPCTILQINPNNGTILLSIFIFLLYMFRATMCPSSGEITVSM